MAVKSGETAALSRSTKGGRGGVFYDFECVQGRRDEMGKESFVKPPPFPPPPPPPPFSPFLTSHVVIHNSIPHSGWGKKERKKRVKRRGERDVRCDARRISGEGKRKKMGKCAFGGKLFLKGRGIFGIAPRGGSCLCAASYLPEKLIAPKHETTWSTTIPH